MAGNNGIQFLRGNSAQRTNSTQTLLPGQPFYETDTTRLYIGGTSDVALNIASPVMAGVNVKGYAYAAGTNSIAIGSYAGANDTNSIAIGSSAYAAGTNSIAIGKSASTNDTDSIAMGNYAYAAGTNSIAIGSYANAYRANSIAIGKSAKANGYDSIAIGKSASANDTDSIAMGNYAKANGTDSIAIGSSAKANGYDSIAIGSSANASADYTIVLGGEGIQHLRCQKQSIESLSDERVKTNITLANTSLCLEDVNRLPVKRFEFKKFASPNQIDKHVTGFIAQDTEKVFPKSVSVEDREFSEYDEEGNEVRIPILDEEGNQVFEEDGITPKTEAKKFKIEDVRSMDTAFGIPTLWGAVQELTKITKAQQEKIDELEERIKKLEK